MEVNVRIRRQVLVNTGNYTNCVADVELELEGVRPEEYNEKYQTLSELLSYTLQLETVKVLGQQNFVNNHDAADIIKIYKDGKAEDVEKKMIAAVAKL